MEDGRSDQSEQRGSEGIRGQSVVIPLPSSVPLVVSGGGVVRSCVRVVDGGGGGAWIFCLLLFVVALA